MRCFPGEAFSMVIQLQGKLVNRNDITIPVGTESIGIYKGTDGEKEVLIKILNTVDPELERLVHRFLNNYTK